MQFSKRNLSVGIRVGTDPQGCPLVVIRGDLQRLFLGRTAKPRESGFTADVTRCIYSLIDLLTGFEEIKRLSCLREEKIWFYSCGQTDVNIIKLNDFQKKKMMQ